MRTTHFALFAFLATILGGTTAWAETADEVLAKADKAANGWADQFVLADMVIKDVDGSSKTYEFSTLQKGEKRMIRMLSGEYKDMATLIENQSHIYAWLPGYKKIRRVAAHKMNQSFAGSDFSNADMAFTSWTKVFKARLLKETDKEWELECTAIPGSTAPYPKAFVRVTKGNYQLVHYQFFNDAGEKVKLFESHKIKEWDKDVWRGTQVEVTDNRTGHKTTLMIKKFEVNQGVPDSRFTKRELQWGR